MPYYGDGLPYYYGSSFANHSSLMTGTTRIHTPLSRFSPHLSTITESPLSSIHRYSPVSVVSRPRRVIDTADIDVSTPRILTHDGNRPRNRLRRDRPTIKIRSQALKDNPALREHNEKHEKSVGELLMEKFLIKDKKLENEPDRTGLRLYHQVSLDRGEEVADPVPAKITRRFTRRRSSADIQLDPEQLQREVAYAQVQAEVLDSLLAEEQAVLENEVRRGTLVRKGTVGGPRTVPTFYNMNYPASEGQEDVSAQKSKKPLKKVKKKRRTTEKPTPPEDEETGTSTSSDLESRREESNAKENELKPQMYKIEASNSVGDFSTIWVSSAGETGKRATVEQFRESVRIPVPRKLIEKERTVEEMETEVILPVKKPYIKDTSRNSVYFTVKTPPDLKEPKKFDLKEESSLRNGFQSPEPEPKTKLDLNGERIEALAKGEGAFARVKDSGQKGKGKEVELKTITNISDTEGLVPRGNEKEKAKEKAEELGKDNDALPKLNGDLSPGKTEPAARVKDKCVESKRKEILDKSKGWETLERKGEEEKGEERKGEVEKGDGKGVEGEKRKLEEKRGEEKRGEERRRGEEEDKKKREAAPGEKSGAAEVVPRSPRLPKPSKINTDENNAVEAPELSFGGPTYLANPLKTERDEDVVSPSSPETKPERPSTLPGGSPSSRTETISDQEPPADRPKTGRIAVSCEKDTTLPKRTKYELKKPGEPDRAEPERNLAKPPTIASERSGATDGASPEAAKGKIFAAGVKGNEEKRKETVTEDLKVAEKKVAEGSEKIEEKAAILAGISSPADSPGTRDLSKIPTGEKSLTDPGESLPEVGKVHPGKAPVEKPGDMIEEKGVKAVGIFGGKAEKIEEKKGVKVTKFGPGKLPELAKVAVEKGKDSSSLPGSPKTPGPETRFPWKVKLAETKAPTDKPKVLNKTVSADATKNVAARKPLKQSSSGDEAPKTPDIPKASKAPVGKQLTEQREQKESTFPENGEQVEDALGSLSKSASTESIDFWSVISPESPNVSKARVPFGFQTADKLTDKAVSQVAEEESTSARAEKAAAAEEKGKESAIKEADKKKETDPKISPGAPGTDVPVPVRAEVEEEKEAPVKPKPEREAEPRTEKGKDGPGKKEPRKKRNLQIAIVKEKQRKGEDSSSASTLTPNSVANTPDTSVPASEVSTPVAEIPLPVINIVAAPTPTSPGLPGPEEEGEDPATPTNEQAESGIPKISKWDNRTDLSNVGAEKEGTRVRSATGGESGSVRTTPTTSPGASSGSTPSGTPVGTPGGTPDSSKKKKVVKRKKSSATKKSSVQEKTEKETKDSRKDSSVEKSSLKPPETTSPRLSPRNTPTQRPLDLIRMFYTTPSALLTATPRDLSKVRRAKVKRKKHSSRTPSVSSDSTGSTTSTATTGSSGSTCTELDDDPEHKRMNSTRSNDSGFDGSPRISNCDMACHKKCEKLTGNLCGLNQKLVAEALQSLKRAPSQSLDNQRNSDSSDHFASGRITPPATNLPRFKKYAVTDFNFLKVLGKGSFGKVLLAELRGTECVYAVKCLKKDVVLEDDDVECTLIERKVLTLATRHPYLCHLFCTFQTESHLFFVMEYLNGGDLMFHIQKSGRFPEARARFYAAEIWSGLNFLHKKGIVYRDLKLDNVLLDFEGHIRIADFGMCKLQIFLDRTADTFCGTPDYMAPEIIKGLKYNQAVDWWSYGVLLYEMLTGQSPFSGCDEDELFWSICNERPFIPRYLTQEATDMLVCLLEKDSGKRLPGYEISMHPFFQSLPWDRLERRQLEPPFKPALDHTLDTRYFDTAFTAERPRLTPVPEQILTSMDQGVFRGFSYTNPNATD